MKTKTLLIAAVLFLALSVSAYAQSSYTVAQETLDKVACCGLAELTGAIAFTAVADTPATITGTITLRYNLPIANVLTGVGVSGGYGVQVTAVGAGVAGPQPSWTIANDGSNGVIVIAVPQGYTYPNTIRVSNVRVNVSGSCGTLDDAVEAHASSTGNFLTIGETDAIALVKGVAQPLRTPSVPSPFVIDATDGTYTGTGAITITENFITAFGPTGVFPYPNASQQTLVRLKVSPIPTDVAITFPGTAGIFVTASSVGVPSGAPVTLSGSANPQYLYYVMNAASNPAASDSFTVTPTAVTLTGLFPKAPATITVSASMGPLTTSSTASLYPQFVLDTCETAAVTLASISGVMNTTLMVPYLTFEDVGEMGVFDTGLAIANTTKDPGTTAMGGYPGAVPQPGKITIYFYPRSGPAIATWVSTSYPNLYGLDASGLLPAGGTFVAMLSEVLPTSVEVFGGYLIIVTDFTNAHGEYFISNWGSFTHGALMLVVNDINNMSAGRTQEQGLNQ